MKHMRLDNLITFFNQPHVLKTLVKRKLIQRNHNLYALVWRKMIKTWFEGKKQNRRIEMGKLQLIQLGKLVIYIYIYIYILFFGWLTVL